MDLQTTDIDCEESVNHSFYGTSWNGEFSIQDVIEYIANDWDGSLEALENPDYSTIIGSSGAAVAAYLKSLVDEVRCTSNNTSSLCDSINRIRLDRFFLR